MSLQPLAICIESEETFAIAEALDPSFKKINYDTIKGWWLLINYPEQGINQLRRPDEFPETTRLMALSRIKIWTIED